MKKRKPKPWEKLSISKSTYYRNKARAKAKTGVPGSPGDAARAAIVDASKALRAAFPKRWVAVDPKKAGLPDAATAFAYNPTYDERKAYADEMVERALVENFILTVGAENMLREHARGQIVTITSACARALSEYASYALIKKDYERVRAEQAKAETAAEATNQPDAPRHSAMLNCRLIVRHNEAADHLFYFPRLPQETAGDAFVSLENYLICPLEMFSPRQIDMAVKKYQKKAKQS